MIRWTSVITDPAEITIAIVNNYAGTYPTALSRIIKVGLPKEQGQYVIGSRAFDGLKEGEGYQINLLTKEAGSILAQSSRFTLSSWDLTDTDNPSNSGEEKGNQNKNGKSHQKHPSNPDNDKGETVRIHYNKTTADQILGRTPRYDGERTRCSIRKKLGHGVVRIVRRAY
ncbi:hypothetical protein CROQUDRAFT_658481 [Cronartium quercuum f. sp. fusiforme G11]|uniref:Yeast cell wall synthesis Kre9/Knh1-like N-terminal domain-containing protein n=1 Tax=Cronartium quercuum f. sp. fusiforme G11 TaxID=708437 RepID=A0A9P6NK82_9BASI|nr:hypothetical protein CROQUDRAFT_658481 [Cronartium quercuum f. sp. fusiforme G11]